MRPDIYYTKSVMNSLIMCLSTVCVSLSTDLWQWVGRLGKDASYVHHMWQGGPGELQSHVSAEHPQPATLHQVSHGHLRLHSMFLHNPVILW